MKRTVTLILVIAVLFSMTSIFSSCGYECDTCKDKQEIECNYCDGARSYDCDTCGGEGSFECILCDGTGKTMCAFCAGMGSKYEMNVISNRFETKVCFHCSGSGKATCPKVSDCEACTGGRITCLVCDSEGNVPCPDCS